MILFLLIWWLTSFCNINCEERFVEEVLRAAAGVYHNKTQATFLGIDKSVMITTISSHDPGTVHYAVYLRNLLCFMHHHRLDLIVYVLHPKNDDYLVQHLRRLGVSVISFPEQLFWQLISRKTSPIKVGKNHADYKGVFPSFSSFGSLVMLVPVLEVLQLGYNVFYLDLDIGILIDPIPYMIKGNADFVSSIEIRGCPEFFTTSHPEKTNWERIEPNTGLMYVRATVGGIKLFKMFLENIIDNNAVNDQRVFDRSKFNARFDPSCYNYSLPPKKMTINSGDSHSPTYCFLPEILFQNGMVGIRCPAKPDHYEYWLMEMNHYGIKLDKSIFPLTLHVNYCNRKTDELKIRGMWLVNEEYSQGDEFRNHSTGSYIQSIGSMCKPFNLSSTNYVKSMNWSTEIQRVEQKWAQIFKQQVHVGALLGRTGGKEVYLIDSYGKRRPIADADTFEKFKFKWDNVKFIPTAVLDMIPEGNVLV
eukprot:gene4990-6975_t